MNPDQSDSEFNFDFSSDASARQSMKKFIRTNFEDLLGEKVDLLNEENGFEKLKQSLQKDIDDATRELPGRINKLLNLLEDL